MPSAWATFRHVASTQGVRALYAGLTPNLVGNGVAWGCYFGLYSMFQRMLHTGDGMQDNSNAPKMVSAPLALLWHSWLLWAVVEDDMVVAKQPSIQSSTAFLSHCVFGAPLRTGDL